MTNRPVLTVRRLLLAVCAAGLALGYVLVAPTSLGGPATWARTAGSSMQPGIDQGDLVIARPQPAYRVGDVIAYRSNHLGGTMIVHRIIGMENGSFLTRMAVRGATLEKPAGARQGSRYTSGTHAVGKHGSDAVITGTMCSQVTS